MGITIKVRVGMRITSFSFRNPFIFSISELHQVTIFEGQYEAPRKSNGTIFKGQKYVKRDHGLLSKITHA